MSGEKTTLESARLVNAVVNAAALAIGSNDPTSVVLDEAGTRFARVTAVLEDVVAALDVPRDLVRLAMDSAIAQGLLDVPRAGEPLIAVRPVTL